MVKRRFPAIFYGLPYSQEQYDSATKSLEGISSFPEEGAYFKGKCNVINTLGTSSISPKMKSLDPNVNEIETSKSEEIIQESIV